MTTFLANTRSLDSQTDPEPISFKKHPVSQGEDIDKLHAMQPKLS